MTMQITDRLQKVLDAGSTAALFPLLKDWDTAELRSLIADVDAYCDEINGAILKAHGALATQPGNFFSKSRSKSVDVARDDAAINNMAMCSEIISVALYYLGDDEGGGK